MNANLLLSFLFWRGLILAFIVYPKPEAESVYKFETVTKTDTLLSLLPILFMFLKL